MNPRSLLNRRHVASVVTSGLLVFGIAACSVSARGVGGDTDVSGPTVSRSGPSTAGSMGIVVRFDDQAVNGTLNDTTAGRQFAAMLPMEIELRDPMGQAKSGPLGEGLNVIGADRTTDAAVGEIGYWESSRTLAIFYDDLGQTLPAPGLVRLGTTGTTVSALGEAGNRVVVRVELVDGIAGLTAEPR